VVGQVALHQVGDRAVHHALALGGILGRSPYFIKHSLILNKLMRQNLTSDLNMKK